LIAKVTLEIPAVGLQFAVHGAAGGEGEQLDGVHGGEQLKGPSHEVP
jgi:hypothetical protein